LASENLVTIFRRDLHKIPEIGFREHKTSDYLKRALVRMGYKPFSVAGTGVAVHIKGNSDETIAFRADMDGLPIMEETELDFKSENPFMMHACGHDGHMSMLLGLARALNDFDVFEKSILLLFQPAEEGPGGAKVIIEEGILEKYNVKEIYGFHLYPGLDEGFIGCRPGPFMARSGEFDIEIFGIQSHAGLPHHGRDALIAGVDLVADFNNIIARNFDPSDPVVINVGKFRSGQTRNTVSDYTEINGTIRAFSQISYDFVKSRIEDKVKGIKISHNLSAELTIRDFYPEVNNDLKLLREISETTTNLKFVNIDPLMLSEDFSYYLEKVPGVFMMLGCGNTEKGYDNPLHSSKFNFDEKVLIDGILLYVNFLIKKQVIFNI